MSIQVITDPILNGTKHGFFTRQGGYSTGVFAGLNCGLGSHDDTKTVQKNRAIVAQKMDVTSDSLITVNQTHSTDVDIFDKPRTYRPDADAIVTSVCGIALGILTADCAPILFSDQKSGVIGAAHAGWKGALGNIVDKTLSAMETLGASRQDIVAVIGPCISHSQYEVGHEFFERFADENQQYTQFFVNKNDDKMLFNLPSFLLDQLRTSCVGEATWLNRCTYSEPDLFYSHRRAVHANETDFGRLISVIKIDT